MLFSTSKSALFWYTFALVKLLLKSRRISIELQKYKRTAKILPILYVVPFCLQLVTSKSSDGAVWTSCLLASTILAVSQQPVPQTLFYGCCPQSNLHLCQVQPGHCKTLSWEETDLSKCFSTMGKPTASRLHFEVADRCIYL